MVRSRREGTRPSDRRNQPVQAVPGKVAVTSGQHVVIVDGVPETATVLREVFGPRGHRVDRIRSFDEAPSPAIDPADVLIVHEDSPVTSRHTRDTPQQRRIVIGSIATSESTPDGEQRLSHPFQYAELNRAVEALLDEPARRRAVA